MSFNPTKLLNSAVANIICFLLFGERYDYQDENFQQLQKAIGNVFEFFQKTLPVSEFNLFDIVWCKCLLLGRLGLCLVFSSIFAAPIQFLLHEYDEQSNLKLFLLMQFYVDPLWAVQNQTDFSDFNSRFYMQSPTKLFKVESDSMRTGSRQIMHAFDIEIG